MAVRITDIEDSKNKDKDQMVLVTVRDRNLKPHYYICYDMDTAKRLYPSSEKRLVTVKK